MNIIKPTIVKKPWGFEKILFEQSEYISKILHINADQRLSLQLHRFKEETLYVLSGCVYVEFFDDETTLVTTVVLKPDESIHIASNRVHRICATIESEVLETSTPHPTDIIRISDDYGRVSDAQ